MSSEAMPQGSLLTDRRALVAIDLGAGSCRVALLRWRNDRPSIQFVHRFANGPVETSAGLRWDMDRICAGVEVGLRYCAELAPEGIAAIGTDGWAVDYVRLDASGHPLAQPFCYRDMRNAAAEEVVHAIISPDRLYTLTGVQRLRFNTVYQLYADHLAGVPRSAPWINLPEYVLYRLGARRISEYTNATHTGLVDIQTRNWCAEIFEALGLDLAAAPELVLPGTDVGQLSGPLAALAAFRHTRLIAPACHDTASAIAGIPAHGAGWAYISSGTWSLVGAVLDRPCTSGEARADDFTNLGAAGGRICFHKNINGMWLIQQSMEHWASRGYRWDLPQLIERAARVEAPDEVFDVDDPDLMLPGDMPARINRQRRTHGLPPLSEDPQQAPAFASLIFHSLASRYAETTRAIGRATAQQLSDLYIVGGGSQNSLLNRLTEEATNLRVHCCQVESSTIGNFAIQLAALAEPDTTPSHASISARAQELQSAF